MMPDIGIKIGLEGEKAFSSALKDINSGLKLLSSEMRAVSSQFLDNNKSIESYITLHNTSFCSFICPPIYLQHTTN